MKRLSRRRLRVLSGALSVAALSVAGTLPQAHAAPAEGAGHPAPAEWKTPATEDRSAPAGEPETGEEGTVAAPPAAVAVMEIAEGVGAGIAAAAAIEPEIEAGIDTETEPETGAGTGAETGTETGAGIEAEAARSRAGVAHDTCADEEPGAGSPDDGSGGAGTNAQPAEPERTGDAAPVAPVPAAETPRAEPPAAEVPTAGLPAAVAPDTHAPAARPAAAGASDPDVADAPEPGSGNPGAGIPRSDVSGAEEPRPGRPGAAASGADASGPGSPADGTDQTDASAETDEGDEGDDGFEPPDSRIAPSDYARDASAGQLSRTGGDIWLPLASGVGGLAALGAGAVVVARKRRNA